ncbi:MAG TPA: phosphoglycerate dehydrogenase [Longilinea sp.]|nr:phosphoglycerate dehydrogenase [Longilinea sp.]
MADILLTAPYMLPFRARFQPVFDQYKLSIIQPEVKERLEADQILKFAGTFDGTICGDDRYNRQVIEACLPRLKVISKWGTGIDSIDRQVAEELGIKVCNTPNAFTLPVSDSVLGYILAFARRQPWMDRSVRSGEWIKLPGRSLSECTLGVIGLGNIGKAVIRRARPFGMRIVGNDIVPIAPDFLVENNVSMLPLEELLAQADFISVNCDLNPTSHHLINESTLANIKAGAVLINTARGPIVKETALIEALQSKKLGGAALDVYEFEPLPSDSPLRNLDQVMLGTHNSNSSPAAWENVHWNTLRNLIMALGMNPAALDSMRGSI